jgi:hypothetical protein
MTEEQPVPVGEALPGISIYPLPDRWTPLSAIVLVKCLDEDGDLLDLYGDEDDDD